MPRNPVPVAIIARSFRQTGANGSVEHEKHGGRGHVAVFGEDLAFVVERALPERQCAFHGIQHLGAAGMADKAVDIGQVQPVAGERCGDDRSDP